MFCTFLEQITKANSSDCLILDQLRTFAFAEQNIYRPRCVSRHNIGDYVNSGLVAILFRAQNSV